MADKLAQDQLPAETTISGDLPIRPAQTTTLKDDAVTEGPKDADVQAKGGNDDGEKPKLKQGSQTTRFEEDLSAAVGPMIAAEMQPKKKRKNTRPKIKRGEGQPTGFEEWACEGPLTLEEYELDRSLYSQSKSFIDRIEEALMRFERMRRIESNRRNIFHKYLQYGGISIGPNFGTGVPLKELKEMTRDEAMQARTQTMIEKERALLDISFDEVVRGFLGSFFTQYFNPEDEEAIKFTTRTITNFYNFLLLHNVCPEYELDILNARKTCKLAETELWKIHQLICKAPGAYNKSCSKLFGGHYFQYTLYDDDEWGQPEEVDGIPLTTELAQKIVRHAIAGATTHGVTSRFLMQVKDKALTAEKIEDIDGFEVICVNEPGMSCLNFYNALARDLTPVGQMRARLFRDPSKPEIDMSREERKNWDPRGSCSRDGLSNRRDCATCDFEFFVEPEIAKFFFPGMKVFTNVWKLSCGAFFFDIIYSAYPSFWTPIANDLMINWKRPRDLTKEDEQDEDAGVSNEAVQAAVKKALEATGHKANEGDNGSEKAQSDDTVQTVVKAPGPKVDEEKDTKSDN